MSAAVAKILDSLAGLSPAPGLIAAAALVIAALGLLGSGIDRRADPARAFAIGMGAFVVIQTLLGVAGVDLRVGVAAVALAALAVAPARRDWLAAWGRPLAVALGLLLPLLLLLSDRRGSEWDEFSHWLHAFRYLAATNLLPGVTGAPPIGSCCAAYPYAWPMIGHAAQLLTGYSEAMPVILNIGVLGLFGVGLAKLAQDGAGKSGQPGAGLLAAGLLVATVAGPSFVHKLAFSAYADVITALLVAMLVLSGERLAADEPDDDPVWRRALAFGLVGAALLMVKPGNVALFGSVLGGTALILWRWSGWRALLRPGLLPGVLLPLLVLGLWRWHVGHSLAGQEMGVRPFETWNLALIPDIAAAMVEVATQKGGHFGLGVLMVGLGGLGLVRARGRADRLAALGGLLFLGYNLFLLTTYVIVFGAEDGLKVVSFWRYNTHLGLALLLPAAWLAGRGLGRILAGGRGRAPGILAILLVLAGPLALLPLIRFDIDPMKRHLRASLRLVPDRVPAGESVIIADPEGSGLSWVMAGYEWDGRLRYTGGISAFFAVDPRVWLEGRAESWAFLPSGGGAMGFDDGSAALLLHRDATGAWAVVDRYPYPGNRHPARFP